MVKSRRGGITLLSCALAAISFSAQTTFGHLTRDECIQGSGCIAGAQGGQATFNFTATTKANPILHSGNFTYIDTAAGISLSSSTLIDYGDGSTESERLLAYQLNSDVYSEARLFVTDSGPTGSDSLRIQLLDLSGVPVIENFGVLIESCGGGISTAVECIAPVPCELQVTVTCALTAGGSQQNECTVTNSSAEVVFFPTYSVAT